MEIFENIVVLLTLSFWYVNEEPIEGLYKLCLELLVGNNNTSILAVVRDLSHESSAITEL